MTNDEEKKIAEKEAENLEAPALLGRLKIGSTHRATPVSNTGLCLNKDRTFDDSSAGGLIAPARDSRRSAACRPPKPCGSTC